MVCIRWEFVCSLEMFGSQGLHRLQVHIRRSRQAEGLRQPPAKRTTLRAGAVFEWRSGGHTRPARCIEEVIHNKTPESCLLPHVYVGFAERATP